MFSHRDKAEVRIEQARLCMVSATVAKYRLDVTS